VLTRDDSTDIVRAYLNGAERWNFVDSAQDAVFVGPSQIIRFFQDDVVTGQTDAESGFVDRIRIFDRALSATEIVELVNPPPPHPFPAYDQRGAPFARLADGDGVNGAKVDMGAYELQPPPLVGDYNQNTAVSAADYVVWRKFFGATDVAPYVGADGTGDGAIDEEDYGVWTSQFGRTLAPGGGEASGLEVFDVGIVSFSVLDEVGPISSSQASTGQQQPEAAWAAGPSFDAPSRNLDSHRRAGVISKRRLATNIDAGWDRALVRWLNELDRRVPLRPNELTESVLSDAAKSTKSVAEHWKTIDAAFGSVSEFTRSSTAIAGGVLRR
jgi:hypothetical protein